ncbi:MAG TPA: cytochrome c [Polyangiales bacterium]
MVAASTSAQAAPPAKALPPRQDLPLVLRETLHATMHRHGEELTFLLADVVLLQYEEAEELADLLAHEPKLGRPTPGDTDSLNALLPEAFFIHQAQLRERAALLAEAARARDDAGLVKAFGALAETCVGCHSSYLNDPLNAVPDHDEDEARK